MEENNFHQVQKDSQSFSDLDQMVNQAKMLQVDPFFIIGLINTIKNGYKLSKEEPNPLKEDSSVEEEALRLYPVDIREVQHGLRFIVVDSNKCYREIFIAGSKFKEGRSVDREEKLPDTLQWLQDRFNIPDKDLDDMQWNTNEVAEFIDDFINHIQSLKK